jgi:type 1 glutamine amidotransferase
MVVTRILFFFSLFVYFLVYEPVLAAPKFNWKKVRVLVYTNNDVFDTDGQRLAFRRYIQAGGGFVGLHSVIGTERNWTWFKMLLGGTFLWHPKFQKYSIKIIDPSHPSMAGLPKVWEKEDECYFTKELYPGTRTIMAHDLSTLNPVETDKIKDAAGSYTALYPAAWYHQFDGGYIWITALGHDKKDYQDPTYVRHVLQGIQYVAGQVSKLDFAKAYAASREDAVRY